MKLERPKLNDNKCIWNSFFFYYVWAPFIIDIKSQRVKNVAGILAITNSSDRETKRFKRYLFLGWGRARWERRQTISEKDGERAWVKILRFLHLVIYIKTNSKRSVNETGKGCVHLILHLLFSFFFFCGADGKFDKRKKNNAFNFLFFFVSFLLY